MKKILTILLAALLPLLATGCSGARNDRPAGVIVVRGEAATRETGKFYANHEDGSYSFPLDAAAVYYFDAGGEQAFAGDQHVTSLRFSVNADTGTVTAEAEAGYVPAGDGADRLYVYPLYTEGDSLFFPPAPFAAVDMDRFTDAVTVTPEGSPFRMTVRRAVPVDFFNVTCRRGEEELLFETLRPADMQDSAQYPVPEGTDNVEVTTFDADGGYIGRTFLMYGESACTVDFDAGGRFLDGRTLNLLWPEPPAE